MKTSRKDTAPLAILADGNPSDARLDFNRAGFLPDSSWQEIWIRFFVMVSFAITAGVGGSVFPPKHPVDLVGTIVGAVILVYEGLRAHRRLHLIEDGYQFSERGLERRDGGRATWFYRWSELRATLESPLPTENYARHARLIFYGPQDKPLGSALFAFSNQPAWKAQQWQLLTYAIEHLESVTNRLASPRGHLRSTLSALGITIVCILWTVAVLRFSEREAGNNTLFVTLPVLLFSLPVFIMSLISLCGLRLPNSEQQEANVLDFMRKRPPVRKPMLEGVWYRYPKEGMTYPTPERGKPGVMAVLFLGGASLFAASSEGKGPVLAVAALIGLSGVVLLVHWVRFPTEPDPRTDEFCLLGKSLVVRTRGKEISFPAPAKYPWRGRMAKPSIGGAKDSYGSGRNAYWIDPRYIEPVDGLTSLRS